jgi:DNA-binding transcriptional MerR regulator
MSIGEFSRLTHLSVRTLRRYHDAGLLEPETVDSATGYRYYSADQIPTAQVIHRLRELDVPLANVRQILRTADLDTRTALVAEHLRRLEDQLARTRAAVVSLQRLLRPEPAGLDVELRHVPAMPVAAVAASVDHDTIDVTYGRLGSWVVDHTLAVAGPVREVYLVGPRDTLDPGQWRTEIGWPVFQVAAVNDRASIATGAINQDDREGTETS